MIHIESFDRPVATMLTVNHARHNVRLSPAVRAHQTKNNIFVMDFERPSAIFSWRHIVMRDVLLDNKVKHMAIARAPWGRGERIVGIPLNNDDSRKTLYMERTITKNGKVKKKIIVEDPEPLVDIRMIVPVADYGEVAMIPDFEVHIKHSGQLALRFAYPEDIEEQIANIYVPPYRQRLQ